MQSTNKAAVFPGNRIGKMSENLVCEGWVEAGDRFVREQQLRLGEEGAASSNSLSFAS
jgi:hypothetical protein